MFMDELNFELPVGSFYSTVQGKVPVIPMKVRAGVCGDGDALLWQGRILTLCSSYCYADFLRRRSAAYHQGY